jgi:Protein of Unknown function (DUF2784)
VTISRPAARGEEDSAGVGLTAETVVHCQPGTEDRAMLYQALATLVLLAHLAFVLFVVFGGVAVLRWPRLAWVHLPAVVWGVLIEYAGWICPLTPLENALRQAGGEAGYAGGFVEQYLIPVLYPAALTRAVQVGLGSAVLLLNALVYWRVVRRRARR